MLQGGLGAQASTNCAKCGRPYKGKCLASSNSCFKCDKPSQHTREYGSGGAKPHGKVDNLKVHQGLFEFMPYMPSKK